MSYRRELISHAVGFAAALTLTIVAFATVALSLASPRVSLVLVLGMGLLQIAVHFRYFLRIGFRKSVREDLLLILFSALIILAMVGGTVLIMTNLHRRMM